MRKQQITGIVVSILIAEAVGWIANLFTRGSSEVYKELVQPPLAPPSWLFPVVWTTLYILMGIAAYWAYQYGDFTNRRPLVLYGTQLALNFIWTIVFFRMEGYGMAFAILILLDILVVWMLVDFHRVRRVAAYILIPYLLWIIFATYLNWGIYILN